MSRVYESYILEFFYVPWEAVYSTLAVFGNDGISVESWGASLTFGSSCVAPAVLAVARDIMAFIDYQVGV